MHAAQRPTPEAETRAGRAWFAARAGGRHLALAALFFGLGLGLVWFLATAHAELSLVARYMVGGLFRPELVEQLEARFQGRPPGFLAQQIAIRVAASVFISLTAAGYLRSKQERARRGGRFLRGVRLQDLGGLRRKRSRRARLVAFLVGLGAAVLTGVALYGRQAMDIPDYVTAWLALHSEAAASFFAPVEGRRVIWCDGLLPAGVYPAGDAYAALERGFGRSCPSVLFSIAIGAVAVTGFWGLGLRRWARRQRHRAGEGDYRLAGVPIPGGKECYHVLVTGSPGSGKSTAIKDLLDQIRGRGERAIVYDLSGEYVQLYFRAGKDKLLNPLDRRTENWNIWAEVREEADFDTLARSLFPPGGAEPFWADASAVLFASVARALDERDDRVNRHLYEALTSSPLDELRATLENTPAARLLDPAAGAMPSNLIATVTSRLQAWSLLPDQGGKEAFSIRAFLEAGEGDGWLFLSTGERHAQVLKPLLSLWADIAATTLLARASTPQHRTFCILDEVASLQRLPALPGLLERGRKHGAAVVLGLQAMPQLRDAYGRELAAAIAAQPQTWLVLRTVEPDTAKWLESALGQSEVEEVQESYSMAAAGAATSRDSIAAQERIVQRPVALASEISSLPDHEGFLRIPGGRDVYRVVSGPKQREPLAMPFEPRDVLNHVEDGPVRGGQLEPTPRS